eukprot:gb/GEZJ01000414.1/.p2 GENE.gb/GEZJ01000414.1/~~gb/GEZJ01000414.1/.p2  ORF type:complete len:109 (+),score=9.15 gb/GEZJ01000414.1/:2143-2469(+)
MIKKKRVKSSDDAGWGDANPTSLMIEGDDYAILVDFEGGCTDGWVVEAVNETEESDLQAMRRICEYIDALPVQSKYFRTTNDTLGIFQKYSQIRCFEDRTSDVGQSGG